MNPEEISTPQNEEFSSEEKSFEIPIEPLIEHGILPPIDEADANKILEAAIKARDEYATSQVKEIFSSLPEDLATAVMFSLQTGGSLRDFYETLSTPSKEPSTEEEAKQVLAHYLSQTTTFSADKINRLISSLEEDELMQEGKKAYQSLIEEKKQKLSSIIEQRQALQQKQLESQQQYYDSLREALSSYEAHPQRKNRLEQFIFRTYRTSSGVETPFQAVLSHIASNPQHLVQLAEILLSYDPKKGLDFSKIEEKVSSKAVAKLKASIKDASPTASSSSSTTPDDFFEKWLSR